MLCSRNASNLQRFGDITTFAVHVTACNFEESFSFDKTLKTVEITSHVRFLTHV